MRKHLHWCICIFVFFATVLNYMDRQTLSITAPLIRKEFNLDNNQLGILFSAFFITYGVSVAIIGEFIDRVSIRWSFALVVAWWSLATIMTGTASRLWHLFAFRMLLGAGEAGNWPATARLVSMYLPPKQRTLANSIYMGGGSLGLIIVAPLLVWLSGRYGWRSGFVVIGLLSTLWIAAWIAWFRPAVTDALPRYDSVQRAQRARWSEIVRVPRFWGLLVASIGGNTCLYFLMNWLPTYLVQDRHFAFNMKLGGVVIVPFLGLDLGYLLSGLVVLRLASRGDVGKARRTVLLCSATLMSICVVLTPLASTDALALMALFGTTLGMASWNANYLCFVEELSPSKVSAVAGVVGSAGAFAGALTQPLIGSVSQLFGSFAPVFFGMAALIWAGSAGLLCTQDRGERLPETTWGSARTESSPVSHE
jgi:ACS family hexuronate transporter-like MFS transporter